MKDTLLQGILNTIAPSNCETNVSNIFSSELGSLCNIETDNIGNIISSLNPQSKFKVMIEAHCDEIGLIVTYIDNSGYLYFRPVGLVDVNILAGSEVVVLGMKTVNGVIGKKPIHLQHTDGGVEPSTFDNLFIDLGCDSIDDVKASVSVGDFVTFKPNVSQLSEHRIVSKGIDNKIGIYAIVRIMQCLAEQKLDIGVYGCATVQEELGCRGANICAKRVNPNLSITIDAGFSSDVPNISQRSMGDIKLGKGVIISKGADSNTSYTHLLEQIAKDNDIPHQLQANIFPTRGTNASSIQVSNMGIATCSLLIPTRYMHTPVEMCDLRDVESLVDLVVLTIQKLNSQEKCNAE